MMRTRIESESSISEASKILRLGLAHLHPDLTIRESAKKKRAIVLVTKESHCLRDLFYLQELGELPITIPLVLSNREDLRDLVEQHGIPFALLPSEKFRAEIEIRNAFNEEQSDFVVLARYMQILGEEICGELSGRIINIHHSFLPGFKGAKPYHQAHAHGVKIIGATAHFATKNLDDGPIITQDIAHISHIDSPDDLIAMGRDIERRVLSKAVKLFAEDRVFIAGNRTVIF